MEKFNFKRRNLASGPHLLGLLLIVAGLFALVSPLLFKSESSLGKTLVIGIGAIIIGLTIFSSYGGTLIDYTGKRFKDYLSIVGYKFGKWTTLPEILTVKVISSSFMSTNKPNGISPTFSGKVTDFRILIYPKTSKPFLTFVYSDRDQAVKQATRLASNLNAQLFLNLPEKE